MAGKKGKRHNRKVFEDMISGSSDPGAIISAVSTDKIV